MNNGTIMLYGKNSAQNLQKAFDLAIEHMAIENTNEEKFIKSNTHPNFIHLFKSDDENEISIENTRKIIEFLFQKPSINRNRAVIIEDIENLSHNASNSILKILEEPPLDTLIILTTTKIFSILPTIRSRCLKIFCPVINNLFEKENTIQNYMKSFSTMLKIPENFIEPGITFILSQSKNSTDMHEFSKKYSENFEHFLKLVILYLGYQLLQDTNLKTAKKLLKVQELEILSQNTYPDKANVITAAILVMV